MFLNVCQKKSRPPDICKSFQLNHKPCYISTLTDAVTQKEEYAYLVSTRYVVGNNSRSLHGLSSSLATELPCKRMYQPILQVLHV